MLEAAIGFVAALLTSIPMLGPVVLLLFAAGVEGGSGDPAGGALARAERTRAAHALAAGAALAEGVHVALALYGVAPYLLGRPEIALGMRLVAGLALIALALMAWRTRAAARPLIGRSSPRAFALGVALVLANPGFLVTWLAVLAFSSTHGASGWGAPFVVGAVLGVLAWFLTLLRLARRLGPRLASRLAQVRALVAVGLALLGAWLVVAAASA